MYYHAEKLLLYCFARIVLSYFGLFGSDLYYLFCHI